MIVKWHGIYSSVRKLPGGGPQGSQIGQESYLSQSNSNADCVSSEDRYKWISDLSLIEIVNLVTVGVSSYRFQQHVASDIGIDQLYIQPQNILSQNILDNITKWTSDNQMMLNEDKTKYMIINFTKKYQFATRLHINNNLSV